MKFIKKIIGVICLIISLFIGIIGIIGILDRKIDLETKIVIEIIISYLLLLFLILGIKLLFNPKFGESKKKSNINMKDNTLNKKSLEDINTYIIEFPFFGFKVFYSEKGEEWKYYSGKEVYKWLSQEEIDGINWSWNSCNMVEYITNENIKKKISNISLFINKNGTCRIFVKVLKDLNDKEKKLIIDFMTGQISDGWGEGNFCFKDENGEEFTLSFWKNDENWYIKYIEDELFDELVNEFKKKTKKDCYKIDLIDETPNVLDNKIGGNPYIPIEEEYPLDRNGKPMILLLQVNLKDIKIEGYLNDGIFEIFISQDYDYPSYEYKIKYFKDNLKYKTDFPNISKDNAIPYIKGEYKIKLDRTIDYMSSNDFRFSDLFNEIINNVYGINTNEYEIGFNMYNHNYRNKFMDSIYSNVSKITIGGYADFTQEDPRGYEDIAEKTECIFKLDSLYNTDKIFIGDVGIFFALASKKDIHDKQFDKVYVNFDCC